MEDITLLLILAAIAGLILLYLIRAKKSGKKCIGCPYANDCKNKKACNCKQQNQEQSEE